MKFPLVEFDEDKELPTHLMFNQNFTSPIYNQSLRSEKTYNNLNRYDLYTRGPVTSWSDRTKSRNYLSGTDATNSNVGLSNDFKGNDSAVFYEIPTRPILGIGQLMQANLMNVWQVSDGLFNNSSNASRVTWNTNRQLTYAAPLYAIGNSNYNFDIPLDKTKEYTSETINGNTAIGVNYDYSYELNEALWDRFLFSGYDGTTNSLPNSRLHLWEVNSELSDLVDENCSGALAQSGHSMSIRPQLLRGNRYWERCAKSMFLGVRMFRMCSKNIILPDLLSRSMIQRRLCLFQ